MPIERDNYIVIPADHDSDTVKVEWSQRLSDRNENYYALAYTKSDDLNIKGPIFVQTNMWDQLKSRGTVQGDKLIVKIDGEFQYGQKNDRGDYRFVVFHDKEHKPYQHRFIQAAVHTMAFKLADSFPLDVGTTIDIASNFVGNPLRTF